MAQNKVETLDARKAIKHKSYADATTKRQAATRATKMALFMMQWCKMYGHIVNRRRV